jgi:hypothetical protein
MNLPQHLDLILKKIYFYFIFGGSVPGGMDLRTLKSAPRPTVRLTSVSDPDDFYPDPDTNLDLNTFFGNFSGKFFKLVHEEKLQITLI